MPTWLLLLAAWVGGSIGAGALWIGACVINDRIYGIHR
jgi:hypothetical protein